MKYLGIDYGDRHVGLAIGDDETRVSVPLDTITYARQEGLIASLKQIIITEHIDSIVVGVPFHYKASQEQKKTTEEFIVVLRSSVDCPVEMEDESFTSQQAGRHIQEGGSASKDDHSVAAMLILQSFLDRRIQ